ncbi:MAG: rhodanese-like domain-containing protein [Pseudohongiellaceae bacterium]
MSDIKRINAEQFRIYQKDSRYCIIDVRDHHEYATGSEATVCWPANEINSVTAYEFVNAQKLTPDQTVILLCARGMRASAAAEKLQTLIPNHISVVEGGHAALAIACSTKQKISIERQVRIAAGILVLISIIGSMLIHPALIIFSVFMACGLIFSGITDWCGLGLLMMKMTWNQPRK